MQNFKSSTDLQSEQIRKENVITIVSHVKMLSVSFLGLCLTLLSIEHCNISSTSFNLHQVLKVPLAGVESPDRRKCNPGLLSCDDTRKQGCVCGPAGSQSYPGPPCNVSTSSCTLSSPHLPSPPPPTMSPPTMSPPTLSSPTMYPQCQKLCW